MYRRFRCLSTILVYIDVFLLSFWKSLLKDSLPEKPLTLLFTRALSLGGILHCILHIALRNSYQTSKVTLEKRTRFIYRALKARRAKCGTRQERLLESNDERKARARRARALALLPLDCVMPFQRRKYHSRREPVLNREQRRKYHFSPELG